MSLLRAVAVAAGPAPHTPIRLLARNLATMAEPLKSVDYEVFGRVQGVCFRMYTEGEAKKIGVVGWVKNTSKGTVTGQVQGPEEKVNSIKWEVFSGKALKDNIVGLAFIFHKNSTTAENTAEQEGLAEQGWEP